MKTRIALIGPMGCGKSTIGQALARACHFRFVDVDQFIEETERRTVKQIFEQDGEKIFRQIESKAISEVCHRDQAVIATGGGAVIDATNREIISNSCHVVFLHAKITTLLERTRGDSNRPLLTNNLPLCLSMNYCGCCYPAFC